MAEVRPLELTEVDDVKTFIPEPHCITVITVYVDDQSDSSAYHHAENSAGGADSDLLFADPIDHQAALERAQGYAEKHRCPRIYAKDARP